MFKKIYRLIISLLFFAALPLYAGIVSLNVSVDKKTIALGDCFVYSVTINDDEGKIPSYVPENLYDFNKISLSVSHSINQINGKFTASGTYKYTLSPKRTGKFTILPAVIKCDGRSYFTKSVEIEVVAAGSNQGVHPAGAVQTGVRGNSPQNHREKIFVKASVNKTTVYENEKLIYKFTFYRNVNLISDPEYCPPDFTGFWNDGSKTKERYEVIDGCNCHIDEIDTVLYPVGTGIKTIAPAGLKIAVINAPDADDDFFSALLNNGGKHTETLKADPVEIRVIPLPHNGRPLDFNGAVGSFKIEASIDKQNCKTNEPVTLTVVVSGNGNMKSVIGLNFDNDSSFKRYDAVVSDLSDNVKEFKIVFVPLVPGSRQIPSASLSFFDPVKKRYETLKTAPQAVVVSGGAVSQADTSGLVSGTDFNSMDINYNKPVKDLKQFKGYFVKNPLFYLIFSPFIIFLAVVCIYKKIQTNHAERRENIPSAAQIRKLLRNADSEVSKNNLPAALDLVYSSLTAVAAFKTGISFDKLSSDIINEQLLSSKADKNCIAKIKDLYDKLNFYRFSHVLLNREAVKILIDGIASLL
ncbi:MAG: BatD family protein [Endomicrobium sp.]|jgi:hypothetical protein|nr:BatD family protein [Endomicrobium sp.]